MDCINEFHSTTEVVKFNFSGNFAEKVDSLGDSKFEIEINDNKSRSYDLVYIIVKYDMDAENDASIEFEARTIISYRSGKPCVADLMEQIKSAMVEINQLFAKEANVRKIYSSDDIIYFTDDFAEENLLIDLALKINVVYGA